MVPDATVVTDARCVLFFFNPFVLVRRHKAVRLVGREQVGDAV